MGRFPIPLFRGFLWSCFVWSGEGIPSRRDLEELIPCSIYETSRAALIVNITEEEVKNAFFALNSSNSPGPDGFNAYFFKHARSIVGNDLIDAVLELFSSSKLSRQMNATIVDLIPKTPNPSFFKDFGPMS